MSPDEHELLADLTRVCEHASLFVLEFTAGELSVEAEEACAFRLVDVAEELLRHARHRKFAAGCKLEAAMPAPSPGDGAPDARA